MRLPPQLPRAPFVVFTGALCGGILLFYRGGVQLWAGVVLLCLGALGAIVFSLRPLRYGLRQLHWLPPLLVCAGLGIGVAWLHSPLSDTQVPDGRLARGEVREAALTAYGSRFFVDVDALVTRRGGDVTSFRTRVSLLTDTLPLRPGDKVVFPALFQEPEGSETYRRYLFGRGVDFVSRVPGKYVVNSGHTGSLSSWGAEVQQEVARRMTDSRLSPPVASFVGALLVGSRAEVDTDVRESFAAAGIAHLLAVSGLHVGLLLLLLSVVLLPLDLTGSRLPRYVASVALVWCYALVCGMHAPVVRASVMATCIMVALILQRPRQGINSLALAAYLILFVQPRALFDAGFLLSFAVTLGIMSLAEAMGVGDTGGRRQVRKLVLGVAVPCVAFLCSWMLTATFFHKVPLLFLPANLLLAPLLPIYFGVAALYAGLLCIGIDWGLAAKVLEGGYALLLEVVSKCAGIEGAQVSMWLPEAAVWLYSVALVCFAIWLTVRNKWLWMVAAGAVAASGVIILVSPSPMPPDTVSLTQSFGVCGVRSVSRGEVATVDMPRGGVEGSVLHGRRIIFVDTPLIEMAEPDKPLRCELLVIGSRFRGSLAELRKIIVSDSIAWHPSVSGTRSHEMLTGQEL